MTGIGLTGFTKGAVKSALIGKAMGALMSGNVSSITGTTLKTGAAKLASSGAWINPDKVTNISANLPVAAAAKAKTAVAGVSWQRNTSRMSIGDIEHYNTKWTPGS